MFGSLGVPELLIIFAIILSFSAPGNSRSSARASARASPTFAMAWRIVKKRNRQRWKRRRTR